MGPEPEAMTLYELQGKCARLNAELDALSAAGERNPGRVMRLLTELDEVQRQIADARRRRLAVPTLVDVVDYPRRERQLQTAAG